MPPAAHDRDGDSLEFSDELEKWLQADGPKSLGTLNEVFEEKTFAVVIVLLMLVSATPIPTGGVTLIFQVIVALLAVQMMIGLRAVWMPRRWKDRELGKIVTGKALPFLVRRIRWVEKHSSPRWPWIFQSRMFIRLVGLFVFSFAVVASFAPPFSFLETLPGMGAVLIGLAVILEDFLVFVIGVIVGTGGIVLFVFVGAAIVRFISGLF